MDILYSILVGFLGLVTGALLLVHMVILLVFGIPFSNKLRRMGILKGPSTLQSYGLALLILPILFGLATWGWMALFPGRVIAYCIGVFLSIFLAVGSVMSNPGRIFQYIPHRPEDIDEELLAKFLPGAIAAAKAEEEEGQ